jgi:fermentation-respiration switch protein FrsA (DUF1100 family)
MIPGYPRLIHTDQDMRPADVIAKIAPLPLFLTQGTADTVVPPSNLEGLTAAVFASMRAKYEHYRVKS